MQKNIVIWITCSRRDLFNLASCSAQTLGVKGHVPLLYCSMFYVHTELDKLSRGARGRGLGVTSQESTSCRSFIDFPILRLMSNKMKDVSTSSLNSAMSSNNDLRVDEGCSNIGCWGDCVIAHFSLVLSRHELEALATFHSLHCKPNIAGVAQRVRQHLWIKGIGDVLGGGPSSGGEVVYKIEQWEQIIKLLKSAPLVFK